MISNNNIGHFLYRYNLKISLSEEKECQNASLKTVNKNQFVIGLKLLVLIMIMVALLRKSLPLLRMETTKMLY
jgi:hypothetical protein